MNTSLALVLSCCFAFTLGETPASSPADSKKQQPSALPSPSALPPGTKLAQASPATANSPVPASKPTSLSDAERAALLTRSIRAAKEELEKLQQDEENPASEFRMAETEFQQLDVEWSELDKRIQTLKTEKKINEAELLLKENSILKQKWEGAKERFGLMVQERKTLREKSAAIQAKLKQDQIALDKLTGDAAPPMVIAPGAPGQPANSDSGKEPAKSTPAASAPAPATATTGDTKAEPAASADPQAAPVAKTTEKKPPSKELVIAQKDVQAKEAAATEAKDKAKSITERVESLNKNILLEQKLLDTARKKAEQAKKNIALIDSEIAKSLATDPTRVPELSQQKAEAKEQAETAQTAIANSRERLNELRAELNILQADQIAASRESQKKDGEADLARRKVEELKNPFTLHNLQQWAIDHGPRLLAILVGAILLHLIVQVCSRRIALVVASGSGRGKLKDRENRSLTLTSVVRSAAFVGILGGSIFMILDEVGIPVMPILGGAAVFGLAVAFGAQNLIRDYFSGFMVLLEDQYGINDVVRIGTVAGVVEKITLRVTVLRDLEGIVHFIPHGTITHVSNLTHGWSRALFSIGVAYKEDPKQVMEVLLALAKELRQDPVHGPNILEDPEMLGVDNFGDSAVEIKFFLKTKPLKQWPVKRELLLRIKQRFDELGIEIPFPHRTIYHHYEQDDQTAVHDHPGGTRLAA